jgi:hypothetical protein
MIGARKVDYHYEDNDYARIPARTLLGLIFPPVKCRTIYCDIFISSSKFQFRSMLYVFMGIISHNTIGFTITLSLTNLHSEDIIKIMI